MPLIRAARVVQWRATVPVGWPGYPCVRAARMARYLRRLSLIADSFWIHGSFQREYTMRQPLNLLFQNGLAKCPVEKSWQAVSLSVSAQPQPAGLSVPYSVGVE